MLFLTGTIVMAMRMFYNWILGIQPEVDGLRIDPCCSSALETVTAQVPVRGRILVLTLHPEGTVLTLNGRPVETVKQDPLTGNSYFLIPYKLLDRPCSELTLK